MLAIRTCLLLSILGLAAASGCLGDSGDGAAPADDAAPTAPTNLAVVPREGAAHVTWNDNSSDEAHFMVMRKDPGAAEYKVVATVPTDGTVYHDATVTSGQSYTYQIIAMNEAGAGSKSNEVAFAVP